MNLDLLRDEIATILAEEMDAANDSVVLPECIEGFPQLLQSDRARATRRIAEIASSRGWQIEVMRALDRHQASYVDDLPEAAVFALRDRMEYFEECVQCACDPDDAPPAR